MKIIIGNNSSKLAAVSNQVYSQLKFSLARWQSETYMALASNCESFTLIYTHSSLTSRLFLLTNIPFFLQYFISLFLVHSCSNLFSHSFSHSRSLARSLSLLAAIKQLCCPPCILFTLTCSFIRSLFLSLCSSRARSLVSLFNVRISCQIIYLVFFVLFLYILFVYIVIITIFPTTTH